ncbi:MAG: beta-ketoacyl-[acyl-carrier-protein] synthase family protein [Proteobacteria bacterium]|nr:beta-ketoacyl-[acyl-carrier-protein] synthase family protein [Pseudomonadota bacterium]
MTQQRRVVITGLGVIAPNGHGLKEFSSALSQGHSGLRHQARLQELKFGCQVAGVPQNIEAISEQYFAADERLAMNAAMIFACIAGIDAWRDAGLTLPQWDEDLLYENTGAIVGTGIGGVDTLAEKVVPMTSSGQVKRLGSTMVEQIMASSVSARFSGLFALGNQVTTNSSACSTGTEALIMGVQRIRDGLADRMLVGGAEGANPFVWAGFDAMRVLNRNSNDEPSAASRPLSASAKGFIPGSGGGILVVEELGTALARGARIYAEVLGAAINSGGMRRGGSMTAPSAYSVRRCIRSAMLNAGVESSQLDYINGHLTATGADPMEIANWLSALEVPAAQFPLINSTKSMIGHALGAAGALESIATVLQLHEGFVHPSLNSSDLHPEIQPIAASIPQTVLKKPIQIAAKSSFGFGDVNSCVVFKKWDS